MCVYEGGKFCTVRREYKAMTTELEKNVSIEQGLAFMLSHFSEPLFPRMISTAATDRRQYEVDSKEKAMLYYKAALYEDCRIAGFGVNQTNPDLIFIELDRQDFASMRSFKLALTTTLRNIKEKLGGHPTVIWSGHGYHIIQAIDCPIPLENIKELAAVEPNTSTKFLQFAERYLSGNKQDNGHHPAIKSCMLRIPWSINSKCKNEGLDPEVKIIQKWNGYRPDYRLLLGSFYADLVGKHHKVVPNGHGVRTYPQRQPWGKEVDWIERLFQTPIDDHRKRTRDLILVPYLMLRKGITDEDQICNTIMQWADKCAALRRLDTSRREFERRLYSRIDQVRQERIPHMKLETLKEKYPDLYKKLSVVE
jgi:hypothetical protein